ncbi:MAG: nuclear transport factor 2 family protein [Xanthobacteraceae bacterium]|nr:nuclear transport factor 2 family protein [Xanthobacteraceae bacterium]
MPNQSAAENAASRSIEDRIRAIEDRLDILNLIASHPPSADSGADYFTRQVYTEDGVIDLGGGKAATGNAEVAGLVKTPGHQAAIAGGLAHFCGLPRIDIDGDAAVATSYLQIITPHPTGEPHEVPNHGVTKGFRIHRVGANRWELVRTPDGWKIRRRTLRPLDGTEPARELLRGALKSYETVR